MRDINYLTTENKRLVSYLLLHTTLNIYLPRSSNTKFVFVALSRNVSIEGFCFPSNHTTFGLCHDSLNSVNSAKAI